MRHHFLPALLLSTLLGCSKSDSNPIIDFGEGEGITYRTPTNQPVGPRDYTDWTSDGDWNKQERSLFADLSFDLNGPQRSTLIAYTTAYPNPSYGGQASWALELQRGAGTAFTIQAALVNRNYQVVQRVGPFATGTGVTATLNYIQAGLGTNELYRLYYVVYDANGLVYKGHGDVRYSPQ